MNNLNATPRNLKSVMNRILVAFIIIMAVVIVGGMIYYCFISPKVSDLAASEYFSEEKVYNNSEEIIGLLEQGEYNKIVEEYCNGGHANDMSAETLQTSMDKCGSERGSRVEISKREGYEVEDSGVHYAVTEYVVKYENKEITYTFMFDVNLKLTGITTE